MAWQDREYNRDGSQGIPPLRFSPPPMTRLSLSLIVVCFAVFVVQVVSSRATGQNALQEWGSLTMSHGKALTQPWRWITYQYLHAGVFHIVFNCLAIYFFVPPLERRWGWRKTLGFYTLGGVAAGVFYGVLAMFFGRFTSLVGASGSIFACMGACALFYPEMSIILIFFSVPIRMAVALLGFVFFLTAVLENDYSNAAHLGGLAFGFFGPYLAGPTLSRFARDFRQRRIMRQAQDEREEVAEVDRILEKVHHQGMNSLTWAERRVLKKATEHQRQRDMAAAAKRRGW